MRDVFLFSGRTAAIWLPGGSLQHHVFAAGFGKQPSDFSPQALVFRLLQSVLGQQLLGAGLGLAQDFHVCGHVGDLQLGQTVLALAKEVPGAPQLQVCLGNLKSIAGVPEQLEPFESFFPWASVMRMQVD